MIRLLQSPWLTALVGCLIYLGVTAALIKPSQFEGMRDALGLDGKAAPVDEPSWSFTNPEFDQWVDEIRRQREALDLREQQLQELQTRLETERQELTFATQTIARLENEFDRNVFRIKEQETANLKRQARILAGMAPESAATLLEQMAEDEAVRILVTLKPDEAASILEALSKTDKAGARRAADFTEKIRRALPPDPNANKTTS